MGCARPQLQNLGVAKPVTQLRTGSHSELVEGVAQVVLDGLHAEHHLGGYLAVSQSRGDQLGY